MAEPPLYCRPNSISGQQSRRPAQRSLAPIFPCPARKTPFPVSLFPSTPKHPAIPCALLSHGNPARAPFPPWTAPRVAPLRDSPSPNSEPPSSLFFVVPTGCSSKYAASRARYAAPLAMSSTPGETLRYPCCFCVRSVRRYAKFMNSCVIAATVDAALRALSVRRNAEPCGQPCV